MADERNGLSRGGRRVLFASLAVNLAVLGVALGVFFGDRWGEPHRRFDLTVGPLTRAMDEDHRAALRETLRESGVFARPERAQLRADRAQLLESLRAEQFDRAAFEAILLRQRERLEQGQRIMLRAAGDQIEAMTAADRLAFADRLEEQLRHGPFRPERRERDR